MHDIGKFVVLWMLRGYKWAISPMFPPACRYVPTCSEYAMEAVERYGVVRGGWMAFWRVMRCHPFVRGGHDPVEKGVHDVGDDLLVSLSGPQGLKPMTSCGFDGTTVSRALPILASSGSDGKISGDAGCSFQGGI